MTVVLADSLTKTLRETLSQNHPDMPLLDSCLSETVNDKVKLQKNKWNGRDFRAIFAQYSHTCPALGRKPMHCSPHCPSGTEGQMASFHKPCTLPELGVRLILLKWLFLSSPGESQQCFGLGRWVLLAFCSQLLTLVQILPF
ncbi:hypothetical protein H1C71_033271 [Ictidomys tridecemlineatus]|nr:hypothetical protein H1C71_033271 [Ictidomys tridecemlineatus]